MTSDKIVDTVIEVLYAKDGFDIFWDGLESEERQEIREELKKEIIFILSNGQTIKEFVKEVLNNKNRK